MFIEILLLAAVAAFVLYRLFSVLGKEKGAPPPAFRRNQEENARPQPVHVVPDPSEDDAQDDADASDLERIKRLDPSFNQRDFMVGAKSAYEMIVKSFADGDRATLKSLLTEDVYQDYAAAIDAREETGAEPFELMRLKNASLEGAELSGSEAEITVQFTAELTDGERISQTDEMWTFERDLKSKDPNWRLSDVSAA